MNTARETRTMVVRRNFYNCEDSGKRGKVQKDYVYETLRILYIIKRCICTTVDCNC